MDTSPWDIADSFRLHEAACLIAGVLPLSKRVPDREELPAQAIPIYKALGEAYVLNWYAYHKGRSEDPQWPKAKILKSVDEIPKLHESEPIKNLTGEIASRVELHRWVKAMGIKSAYSFAPVAEMDAAPEQPAARMAPAMHPVEMDGVEWQTEGPASRFTEILNRPEDLPSKELFEAIEKNAAEIQYWEARDDTKASDAAIKQDRLKPLYLERESLQQKKAAMRGDYPDSPPVQKASVPEAVVVNDTTQEADAKPNLKMKIQAETTALTAPTQAGIPEAVVNEKEPKPLSTRATADSFAGLRWNGEQWMKSLGNKPVWLDKCLVLNRGRGEGPRLWNPVLIGGYLVRMGHVKARTVRVRFQTEETLKPWLDAWKTYESEQFPTD